MYRVLSETPMPLDTAAPGLPARLNEIVMRALAKNRRSAYPPRSRWRTPTCRGARVARRRGLVSGHAFTASYDRVGTRRAEDEPVQGDATPARRTLERRRHRGGSARAERMAHRTAKHRGRGSRQPRQPRRLGCIASGSAARRGHIHSCAVARLGFVGAAASSRSPPAGAE